jgi:hypothetical protein
MKCRAINVFEQAPLKWCFSKELNLTSTRRATNTADSRSSIAQKGSQLFANQAYVTVVEGDFTDCAKAR